MALTAITFLKKKVFKHYVQLEVRFASGRVPDLNQPSRTVGGWITTILDNEVGAKIYWSMIDLNRMSTWLSTVCQLWILQVKRLWKNIHCIFIFTLLALLFLIRIFAHGPIEYKWFLNSFLWLINGNLKWTTTPGQSGPGSKGNERVPHTPKISRTGASSSEAV